MRQFLLIPRIKIHNANAMSSPYSIGFPAMTAWLGAVHSLQRKLLPLYPALHLSKVGISCHEFKLHTYKGDKDYVQSIVGTANPLDKSGDRPTFIEEARCDLTVSLLIEMDGLESGDYEGFFEKAKQFLLTMKVASGDVLDVHDFKRESLDEHYSDEDLRAILNQLMLGCVLVSRRDLIKASESEDTLASLLIYLKIMHRPAEIKADDSDKNVEWTIGRLEPGWIVPIAVGFQGVSEVGLAKNQRDFNVPHRFAESVVTLGEFKMPYRINIIDEMLWHYHTDLDKDLYLCLNNESI